jgi:hypothetical protein
VCDAGRGLGGTNYNTVVLQTDSLRSMARELPLSADEMMKKVEGFTGAKWDKFGQQFLDITTKYYAMLASTYMSTLSINNNVIHIAWSECL